MPAARELRRELDTWLSNAGPSTAGPARAIIAPHAGYTYCGACAAFAYKEVDPRRVKRIFILGPSHHIRLGGCALSPAVTYRTPLADLTIDREIYEELYATGLFEEMTMQTDEDEHSIEMHLPYIAHVMQGQEFSVVPILVGSLSPEKEAVYGRLLAKYLVQPDNLFVVSSDFCHWGARFNYQFYDKDWGEIHESISKLDRLAMDVIETLQPADFTSYLKKYGNTICGRHPIGVLLNAARELPSLLAPQSSVSLSFLKYAQSSRCRHANDSSVSYASAALRVN